MAQWMLMTILLVYAAFRVSYVVRRDDDVLFGVVLLAAAATRLATGLVNHYMGPLPGAQIDAVMFEETARTMASVPGSWTNFAIEVGKYGYSSILALLYLVAGPHFLIPTVVNLIFTLEFLIIVYDIGREWGGPTAGRLAAAFAAFYPTSVLYTSVPLREAPLMFAFALFVKTLLDYYEGRRSLFNWRLVASLVLLVWLHDGFVLAVFLIPIAVWFRNDQMTLFQRLAFLGIGLVSLVAAFAVALTFLDMSKMPADPAMLLDPQYLARMREVKSAYGVGYGAFEPTWSGILRTGPLLLFAFVAAPFPIWWNGLGELPKVAEGLFHLCIVIVGCVSVLQLSRDRRLRLFLAMYLYMVFIFAMGTGNTGIAARHRAKFVWMPILATVTVVAQGRRAEEDDNCPEPLAGAASREGVRA